MGLLSTLFSSSATSVLRRAVFVATLACHGCALKNACTQSNAIFVLWHGARDGSTQE